jgi:DNA modification methylase
MASYFNEKTGTLDYQKIAATIEKATFHPGILYSQYIIADCLEVLQKIPDKYFDVVFSDFPWGVKYDGQHPHGINVTHSEHTERTNYCDEFKPEFFLQVWKECCRVSKMTVICPGWFHFNWWVKETDPIGYIIVEFNNGQNSTKTARYSATCPYCCWGDFTKNKFWKNFYEFPIDEKIYKTYITNGFLREKDYVYQHPSPKDFPAWYAMIKDLKVNSLCDPMVGSGTAIQVAEALGIEGLGIECMDYSRDIDYRIGKGRTFFLNQQKNNLDGYIGDAHVSDL